MLAFVSSGIRAYDPFGPNGGELLLVYRMWSPSNVSSGCCQPIFGFGCACTMPPTGPVPGQSLVRRSHVTGAAVLTKDAGEMSPRSVRRLAEFVRDRRERVAPEPNSSGVLGVLRAV